MQILAKPLNREEFQKIADHIFGNMLKAVVDVKREVVAIDAELHVDLAEFLVENGSTGNDLWGINIYPAMSRDDWLEYDSMVNLKPQLGNRSRDVEDPIVRAKIRKILERYVRL
jgi:hypothetical protein